jgi:hypothetical protein
MRRSLLSAFAAFSVLAVLAQAPFGNEWINYNARYWAFWVGSNGLYPQEGLYKLEAKAMVKTWNDSWFSEEGLRVLYTLPRSWTDRTLPLKISPAPTEVVRVMVGRAEIITPSMEWELMKQITRYGENDSRSREEAVVNARAIGLGRFAEAAVRRMVNRLPNREFSQTAWSLLTEMGKGQDKKLALAK